MTGMSSHQSANMGKDEWLTPPYIYTALGTFDLDPCAPIVAPWRCAKKHFDITDNGLAREWTGRVWLNPPYGRDIDQWLKRMAQHANGTALIFARTETAAWQKYVWPYAKAILFIDGRLYFHHVNGKRAAANAGAPSALVAYGAYDADRLRASKIPGFLVTNMERIS